MSNIETFYAKPVRRPHILAVDDDTDVTFYIQTVLKHTCTVAVRDCGAEIEPLIRETKPDLLLLDYLLPGADGCEVCKRLRSNPEFDMMPILFLSGMDTEDYRLKAYAAGADDYIAKPFEAAELRAKVEVWSRLARRSADLLEKTRYFRELAIRDSLTGLIGRRQGLEILQQEMERYQRYAAPFGVLLIDIDDFKMINDEYGHAAGDAALKHIADYLLGTLRANDVVIRYGGDEFLVLLTESGQDVLERICDKIVKRVPPCCLREKEPRPLSLSVGGATVNRQVKSADKLIDHADFAMLSAKKSGKGRFSIYQPQETGGTPDTGVLFRRQRAGLRESVCRIINRLRSDGWADDDQICGLGETVARALQLSVEQRETLRNCLLLALSERFRFRFLMARNSQEFDEDARERLLASIRACNDALQHGGILLEEAAVLEAAFEHHDGSGIPQGLAGEVIPLTARIVAAVAAYAWIRRVEKNDPLPLLRELAGSSYDPKVVQALEMALAANKPAPPTQTVYS